MKTRILGIALTVVLAIGGGALLTGYVRSADARALAGAQPVHAYVAVKAIPRGTSGEDARSFLTVKDVPAASLVDGRVTNLAQLDGLEANATIEPGEQILRARFSDPAKIASGTATALPNGLQAVSVKLPLEQAVGGTLRSGDLVGVFIADGTGNLNLAKQSLHKVLVLAVQNGAETKAGTNGSAPTSQDVQIVTLALSGQDATKLVWGQKFGTVWLAQETDSSVDGTRSVGSGTCNSSCVTVHP